MDIVSIDRLEEFAKKEVVKKIPMMTESSVICLYYFMKGQEIALHKHTNCDEIIYVVNGTCEIEIGDETEIVKNGNFVLVPVSVSHKIRNITNEKLTILTFMSIECKQQNREA